jgi:hypothetical protein
MVKEFCVMVKEFCVWQHIEPILAELSSVGWPHSSSLSLSSFFQRLSKVK